MKRKFTFLTATLMLLAFLAIPLGMMGQTTVSYGWETSDDATPWTISSEIVATSGQGNTGDYAGKINTNHTYVQFNEKVYVTSFSFAFKRTSNNGNYNVYIETSTDGTTWTAVETYAMSSFLNGSYTTKSHSFDGSTEYYVRFHCYNTTAVRYVDDVSITYASSGANLNPSDLAISPTTLSFDLYNDANPKTINVTSSCTGAITVSGNNYVTTEVNGNTITVTPGTTVTPTTQTLTVSQESDGTYASGTATFTVDITDNTPFTGGDVTFVAGTDMGTTTATGSDSMTKSVVTISSTNAAFGYSDSYRLYKSSVTTISTTEGVITSIAFTEQSSTYAVSYLTPDSGTLENGTWTGSATSVAFTNDGTNQTRATQIVVTVDLGSTPMPSISISNNNEIAYDATSGSFDFSISNPATNGVTTVGENVEWISNAAVSGNTVTFNTEVNNASASRQGIITLTYTYNSTETVTKDVTVTQAGNTNVAYTTIPELFAAATSTETDVNVTFNNWVVSGVSTNGKNVYVTDNNGNGFIIFDNNGGLDQTYSAGKVLAGTSVSCKLVLYKGAAELKNVNAADLTITDGGNVTEATIAMANLSGVNTGALVHYENLTCSVNNSKYYLSDGTTTIQLYNALYAFTNPVAGKIYNITGVYAQYDNTKEIMPSSDADLEEVVSTTPVINASNVTIDYDATFGEIAYTIDNPVATAALNAECTDSWISNINVTSTAVTFTTTQNDGDADRTATFTLTYTGAEAKTVTVTQGHFVVDYAVLPFSFDGGRADIATTNGLTQEGLDTDYNNSPKLKFNGAGDYVLLKINERPGTLSFDIKGNSFSNGTFKVQTSEDGTTYTDLKTYDDSNFGNTLYNEEFDNLGENVRYIKWIYTEKVNGNVALGNIVLEKVDTTPSITLGSYTIDATAASSDGVITVTCKNMGSDPQLDVIFYDATGAPLSTGYSWFYADINSNNEVEYIIDANTGDARTAYFKVYGLDALANEVYSDVVTVNQAAYVAPAVTENYARFTGDLVEGDYLIVFDDRAMNTTIDKNRLQYVDVTPNGDIIATDNAEIIWHIAPSGDHWTIYNADANAYAAGTGTKNQAQMLADGTDDKALWTVSGTETFEFVNKANAAAGINANLRNNSTYGFACYGTGTGGALSLYKKVTTTASYSRTISGYGTSDGGYYLIASPIYGLNPDNVTGMTDGDFDLYYFDQAQNGQEWRNYEAGAFYLTPGKGYLYAKSSNVTLTFEGMPYEGNGVVNLSYVDGAPFSGWNLVGNPRTTNATVDKPYYRLNSEGTELSATTESTVVAAMEGMFVQVTSADQTITFTASTRNTDAKRVAQANIVVSNSRGTVVDNAIVRFDGGATLGKFQLKENSTKVYFTEGNQDYAVVRSEARGEMPVNFKTNENGTYTLDFSMDNVEFNYLHLIDNLTGNNVDLLQTPSYTFEANTNDYTSRFKLVFSTNGNDDINASEQFAFINNGEIILSGINGNTTVQLFDITGRMLSSTNGANRISTENMSAGVYMLRLINGSDVKTQKIIVK